MDSAELEAQREAMLVGRRVADMSVGDDDEDGEWVEKEYKPKGVEGLIEVENANRAPAKMTKLKDMDGSGPAPMTRKEREEKETREEEEILHYVSCMQHFAAITEVSEL